MADQIDYDTARHDVEESERQIELHLALIAQLRSVGLSTALPEKLLRQMKQARDERRSRLTALATDRPGQEAKP